MITKFNDKITDITLARIEEVGKEIVKDKEYIKQGEQLESIFEQIKQALPEDKKRLIGIFEEENTCLGNLYLERIYKQGLKDGLELTACL